MQNLNLRKRSPWIIVGSVILTIAIAVSIVSVTNHLNRGTSSLIKLEPTAFGGTEFLNYDFTTVQDLISNGSGAYYNDYLLISPKAGTYSLKDAITFSIDDYSSEWFIDPYSVIGYNQKMLLNDYSVITFDFDIEVSENYPFRVELRPEIRADEYSTNATGTNSTIIYKNGAFYNGAGKNLMTYDSTKFHFTYVYSNDVAHVYVNGAYLTTCDDVIVDSVATYINGFNYHLIYSSTDVAGPHSVSLDNFVVNTFAPGYDGAIMSLFDKPRVNLVYNPDSILYKGGRPDAE